MSPLENNVSLLVVDDEEGLLFLMTEALRREGYNVHGIESGEAAFRWLAEHRPDLLILDLKLYDLAALALVERLRDRGQEFPFVVITGHGDERTAVEIMRQGALDYVMKDAGLLEFLPTIVRRALSVIERERRLMEANEAIRQQEQQHHKVIQTALDGFARFDTEGRFLEVNEATCRMLGYSAETFFAINVSDIDFAAKAGELSERIKHIRSGEAACFATRLRRSDGSALEVNISMRSEGGETFVFVHDISSQRRLEREILEASEEERRRIGRDLHDGLGQQLTALEFQCHRLARRAAAESPELVNDVAQISAHIRQAVTQTRMLSHGLAPVSLEAEGLSNALRDLARVTSAAAVLCEFCTEDFISIPDANNATHLYRIAQEAVTNALRHANAQTIRISLMDHGDSVELTIEDNGRGLPPPEQRRNGIGLQVMNYRARLIGARLEIHSAPDNGVRVVCNLSKRS